MLVFHGTRMEDPWQGFPNGLQPLGGWDALELAREVLAQEGETIDSVPGWIWEHEVEHRKVEYQGNGPWVSCSTSFRQAQGYTGMGGEFEFCIRRNLWVWRNQRRFRQSNRSRLYRTCNEWASSKNGGYRVVVAIDVDEEFVYSMVGNPEGLRGLIAEGHSWERMQVQVRLPEVRADQIVGLVIVDQVKYDE